MLFKRLKTLMIALETHRPALLTENGKHQRMHNDGGLSSRTQYIQSFFFLQQQLCSLFRALSRAQVYLKPLNLR